MSWPCGIRPSELPQQKILDYRGPLIYFVYRHFLKTFGLSYDNPNITCKGKSDEFDCQKTLLGRLKLDGNIDSYGL